MSEPSAKISVIGIGNLHRQDDAVGRLVARELAKMAPSGVTVGESNGEGTDLLARWKLAEAVIVVDAVVTGATPGTIIRRDLVREPLGDLKPGTSTHAFGLAEAVEMARALGELPAQLLFFGIEAREFATGEAITAAVANAIPALVAELGALLKAAISGEKIPDLTAHSPAHSPAKQSAKQREITMHEMSLLNSLMKTIERIVREQNATRAVTVRVKLGALAHISPDHFREHFEEAARGTVADGAELFVEQLTDENDPNAQEIMLESIDVDD